MRKVWRAPPFGFDEPVRGPSEGGSVRHVKWPDDIGRVAGIGRTVTWDERREFRGSDFGRPAVGWPRAGQNGPAPHAIIVVVVVVVVVVLAVLAAL